MDRETLISQLTFFHGLISASEGLLLRAITKSDGLLKGYYIDHLEEEAGHAAWLAKDLTESGVEIPSIHWQAAMLAGVQYYLIEHVSPYALLGYIAALESGNRAMAELEALEQEHGKTLLRTYRYHVEHDPAHSQRAFEMIEAAPTDQIAIIADNALQTATYIRGVFV